MYILWLAVKCKIYIQFTNFFLTGCNSQRCDLLEKEENRRSIEIIRLHRLRGRRLNVSLVRVHACVEEKTLMHVNGFTSVGLFECFVVPYKMLVQCIHQAEP